MISQRRIGAMRLMAAEVRELVEHVDEFDDEGISRVIAMNLSLVEMIPHLLDEIERLQAGKFGAAHMVKVDLRGGGRA